MKNQQFVLPVQCARCKATFDLWHDLIRRGEEGVLTGRLADSEHLCWRCRNIVNKYEIEDDNIEQDSEEELDVFYE